MSTLLGSIIQRATREPGERLNILSFPTHESYQSSMTGCNANFYLYRGEGIKNWNPQYRQLPKNHTLLDPNKGFAQLPPDIEFDAILSQNPEGQFPIAKQLSQIFNIPLITICHTLPHPQANQHYINHVAALKGDINLYISEFSREKWGANDAEVIHHGIDYNTFKPSLSRKEGKVLSVVNLLRDRDIYCGYHVWEAATQGIPRTLVGDNPGLGAPAKYLFELVKSYQSHQVFLNTSLWSPIPTSLLEAASCACPIVSTTNCCIPEIFRDGENALLSNDPRKLRDNILLLMNDSDLAKRLGENARKTVMEKFSVKDFVKNWDGIFQRVVK